MALRFFSNRVMFRRYVNKLRLSPMHRTCFTAPTQPSFSFNCATGRELCAALVVDCDGEAARVQSTELDQAMLRGQQRQMFKLMLKKASGEKLDNTKYDERVSG